MPGAAHCTRPHLPRAVDFLDRPSLSELCNDSISHLIASCHLWRTDMDEFHASLHTPAAKTLWNALLSGDVELVRQAESRLHEELDERMRS